MFALGLLLNTAGIAIFCWLVLRLAIYALPVFVAVNAGVMAFYGGAGLPGAPLAGIAAGAVALALGKAACAMTRSVILRAFVAATFALPAAIAGYHVVLVMSRIGASSLACREVLACLGAAFIGGTAWARLTVFTKFRPLDPGVVEKAQQVLSGAGRKG